MAFDDFFPSDFNVPEVHFIGCVIGDAPINCLSVCCKERLFDIYGFE